MSDCFINYDFKVKSKLIESKLKFFPENVFIGYNDYVGGVIQEPSRSKSFESFRLLSK
jgi:hypothetical protein